MLMIENYNFKNPFIEINNIIHAEVLARVYVELKNYFKNQYSDYYKLLKENYFTEISMAELNVLRDVIKDIIISEHYNLQGIACYTDTPTDVIYDVAIGKNKNPSVDLFQKIIELHRAIRPELYADIMKKIKDETF